MHTHVWSRGAIQTAPICSAPTCLEQGKAVPLAAPRWTAQRGPRTAPWHGFLRTDPGQSNSRWEGAAVGGRGAACALTPAEGLCPAPPRRLLPRTEPWGAAQGGGPGRPSSPSRRPGDTGAHRAGIEPPSVPSAGLRVPFYITGGSAAVTQRSAGLPRPGRGTGGREGRGPRLSPSAGLTPPPWRPLPRGHLRYLRRVRHPGAAGEQLPFPSLPASLLPSLPARHPLTAPSPSRRWVPPASAQPAGPVAGLLLFSLFSLSLPPFPRVYPHPPDLEVNAASTGREPASLKGAAPARLVPCWGSRAQDSRLRLQVWGEGAMAQQSSSASLVTSVWKIFFGLVAPVVEPGPGNSARPAGAGEQQPRGAPTATNGRRLHPPCSRASAV